MTGHGDPTGAAARAALLRLGRLFDIGRARILGQVADQVEIQINAKSNSIEF